MPFRYDTYCGLYCGACEILLANEKGSVEALAQAWNRDPESLRFECGLHAAWRA